MIRAAALLGALALAGCAAPEGGGGVKMGINLPTEVQVGIAGGSGESARPVGRVTGWKPHVLVGADENDRRF